MAPAFEQAYLNLARVYAIEGDKANARATLLQLLKVASRIRCRHGKSWRRWGSRLLWIDTTARIAVDAVFLRNVRC